MIEESFINTIDSNDDKSDANSIGEDITDIKVGQHYLSYIICYEKERQITIDPCKHFKLYTQFVVLLSKMAHLYIVNH